jgi:8-oxo-dGTP pyrophosphatase MutT (NUDIX family)
MEDVKLLRGLIREMCKNKVYWGRGGAGMLFTCSEDGTVLMLLRSAWVDQGGTWGVPGGGIGERHYRTPIEDPITDMSVFMKTARREVKEECGSMPPGFKMSQIVGKNLYEDCGFKYFTFIADITKGQKAAWKLVSNDGETDQFKWVPRSELSPGCSVDGRRLHFGIEHTLFSK